MKSINQLGLLCGFMLLAHRFISTLFLPSSWIKGKFLACMLSVSLEITPRLSRYLFGSSPVSWKIIQRTRNVSRIFVDQRCCFFIFTPAAGELLIPLAKKVVRHADFSTLGFMSTWRGHRDVSRISSPFPPFVPVVQQSGWYGRIQLHACIWSTILRSADRSWKRN